MGEVYRARDTRLGREVAIKVLPERVAGNPELRERFESEARAVASLSHPGRPALRRSSRRESLPPLVPVNGSSGVPSGRRSSVCGVR